MDYLRYTGRQVDGVFLSHGHADHGGGLLEVLKERRVPVIYLPQGFEAAGWMSRWPRPWTWPGTRGWRYAIWPRAARCPCRPR